MADQLVADLNIIETLEANAALVALTNFLHILFFMAQGGEIAFVDHVGPTEETHARTAP